MTLYLDPSFEPHKDDKIEFQHFLFPGGEPHFKILSSDISGQKINVVHRINSFNDLGLLLVAVDALKRLGAIMVNLFIPYLPGARQDRLMMNGEPLTIKVYTTLLNQLGFQKIKIFDAHSDVGPALLDSVENISNHQFIKQVASSFHQPFKLIAPDGGALKKIYKLSEELNGVEVIECSKTRDTQSGKLKGFKVNADDLEQVDCLIVDDICDGGGTFIGIASELKQKNAGRIYLAVSHGIFSKGYDELQNSISHIYTTNSIRDIHHPFITQINFSTFM